MLPIVCILYGLLTRLRRVKSKVSRVLLIQVHVIHYTFCRIKVNQLLYIDIAILHRGHESWGILQVVGYRLDNHDRL